MKHKGRDAINILKDQYRAGIADFGKTDARDLLVACGFKKSKLIVPLNEWMRQAQLELAEDELVATTHRVHANDYKTATGDKADAKKRELAYYYRMKDSHTRLVNDWTMAIAAAAQPDATGQEKALAVLMEGQVKQHEAALMLAESAVDAP